jgi:VanZ family protein
VALLLLGADQLVSLITRLGAALGLADLSQSAQPFPGALGTLFPDAIFSVNTLGHMVGFFVLGWVVGRARQWLPGWLAPMALLAFLSLAGEAIQLFSVGREISVDDFLVNLISSWLGCCIARGLMRQRAGLRRTQK